MGVIGDFRARGWVFFFFFFFFFFRTLSPTILSNSPRDKETKQDKEKRLLRQCLTFARKAFFNDPNWPGGLYWAIRAGKALDMDVVELYKNLKRTMESVQEEVMAGFCVI